MHQSRAGVLALVCSLALGFAGCSPTPSTVPSPAASQPTSAPTVVLPTVIQPTAVPPTALPASSAEPQPAEPSATAIPPVPTPALDSGEVVLQLEAGAGPNQVGIETNENGSDGPRSFRIGSDGSIRLLDQRNHRLLFFNQNGKLAHTLQLPENQNIHDFIVDNSGDTYVLANDPASEQAQVFRYRQDGTLVEQIPVAPGVGNADGIMLTADNTLLLVQNNSQSWVIRHRNVLTPPEIQPLTQTGAVPTPRSPALFNSVGTPEERMRVDVTVLNAGAGNMVTSAGSVQTNLLAGNLFFNVDRAMNLYFASDFLEPKVNIYRVAPEGNLLGGTQIDVSQCSPISRSWRSFYVDQVGSAWALCISANGATISRYTLRDEQQQPLPAARPDPADVAWRPGANFNSA